MAWFKRKNSKKDCLPAAWRVRWMGEAAPKRQWITRGQVLYALGFLFFAALVSFICFAGYSPAGIHVLPGQISKNRVVSTLPFSYESKVERKRLIEELSQKVAPCYKLNLEPYQVFRTRILAFDQGLSDWEKRTAGLTPIDRLQSLEAFIQSFNQQNRLHFQLEDVQHLLVLDPETRSQVIEEGLLYLRDILSAGIIDPYSLPSDPQRPAFISIHIEGQKGTTTVQSPEEAFLALRRYLRVLEVDPSISGALFRILKNGVAPNLLFDPAQRNEKLQQVAANIAPVVVHVEAGTLLLDQGAIVTQEQYERLAAYAQVLRNHDSAYYGLSITLWDNLLLCIILLLGGVIYIHLSFTAAHKTPRALGLFGLVLVFSLMAIRLLFFLGDLLFVTDSFAIAVLLPYLAPVALGPMLVAIMLGGGPAILMSLLVSALTTLMHAKGLDVCIIYLISSLVGVSISCGARMRTRVVRAGALAGLSSALGAAFLGLDEVPFGVLSEQVGIALLTGIVTGIVVIGLLPLLEHLFKLTTDITLLELTDFNHPLLRRLQMVAPGTYHHSLMVANLAERAAAEIGSNPLACRAASLFHDIGKMIKPEYFIENQQEGFNPHQSRSPSMSALVIKHHVKEGVEIAREAKLPKIIIDVIEQHHGTTLIQYFYAKALQQNKGTQDPFPSHPLEHVDEATYRYDGPKPSFKESAIIFFADSIEAASRSLKKVTPQNVEDLVEKIFNDRLTHHQLDNCPLTFKELSDLKKSFAFTLLNMLHTRIEYPGSDKED